MSLGILINGLGRMGRVITRAICDEIDYAGNMLFKNNLYIAGFNDVHDVKNAEYLLQYDTAYGIWEKDVIATANGQPDMLDILTIAGKDYPFGHASTVDDLLTVFNQVEQQGNKIDVILDCSGSMTASNLQTLRRGCSAKLVIACYPVLKNSSTDADFVPYVAYGVNEKMIGDVSGNYPVICMASPDVQIVSNIINAIGQSDIETYVAYSSRSNSNVQFVEDSYNRNYPPLGKAASWNIVPSTSSNAKYLHLIMPQLNAFGTLVESRALTLTGGVVNICLRMKQNTTLNDINLAIKNNIPAAINGASVYKIATMGHPLASSDALYQPYAGIVLSNFTEVVGTGKTVTVTAVYDNEYGQAIQTLREIDFYMYGY